MGSTTIQISRFYLPHDQIDYPLVDVRTTKKSLTSQLRRWKPQSNPTVPFCIPHAFPADVPQQFNNSFHPRNNDPSTANQINSIPYVPPLLLRLHASNASNASPFHIDPSKPTPIHASHGICPFLFNIPIAIFRSSIFRLIQPIHVNHRSPQLLSSSVHSYRQPVSLLTLILSERSRASEKHPTELSHLT